MSKDYIDREALLKEIKTFSCKRCNSYGGVVCRACGVDGALNFIENAPAADVAPVVYGEWIAPTNGADNPDEWRECSRCGNLIDVHFPTALPKFCEECGAKMTNGGERDD